MKILLICKALPHTFKGGIQTHVWALSRELLALGHEVSILTGGSLRRARRTYSREGRTIHEVPHIPGRIVPFLPTVLEELSFNLAVSRWLLRHREAFDIIHLQGRSGLLFPKARRHGATVMTIHRLFSVESQWGKAEYRTALDRWLHRRLTLALERRGIRHADALIGISESTIREVQERFPDLATSIRLIYNGTDSPASAMDGVFHHNRLLFVGRLTEVKGIFPLVECLPQVKPGIRLTIVGDGPARARLEQRIEALGLGSRVELLGAREAAAVHQLMQHSFALILPSFHESQGIVLMENNACRRPVLAADTAGIREVVFHERNGLLFQPGNKDAMARAINQLFDNPEEATRMGQWGEQFIAGRFSWKQIALETENIYTSLL